MRDLEKLKKLDPQEVYKKTYIAPKVLQALLEEDFAKLGNKTKALGFVAILERELGLDLGELREKIEAYFGVHEIPNVFEIREATTPPRRTWLPALIVAAVVAGGAGWYLMGTTGSQESDASEQKVTAPLKSERPHTPLLERNETNASSKPTQPPPKEVNQTTVHEQNVSLAQIQATPDTLTFIPKKRLWLGIIYLDDYSRKNYISDSPIEINTSRDQLIITGHGAFEIEYNNKVEEFNAQGKQRFLYRAGELEKIDAKTFKRYNRGKEW